MSNTMNDLEEMLRANEEKAQAFKEALKRAAESGAANDAEAISVAAGELGLTITPEDVEKSLAEAAELSDEDLEQAAGGLAMIGQDEHYHENFCFTGWHCALITMHTESKSTNVFCFSNYACFSVYHLNYYDKW